MSKYKKEGVIEDIFEDCKEKLALIFHPIAPHLTEEVWEVMGKNKYNSLSSWPDYDKTILTNDNEFKWNLMNKTINDISNIRVATKINEIKETRIIIADDWKFEFYSTLISLIDKTKNYAEIMKELMQNDLLKIHNKFITQTTAKILKNVGKYSKHIIDTVEEFKFFDEIKRIIKKRFRCEVKILLEKDSKIKKASQSLPGRPAIVKT